MIHARGYMVRLLNTYLGGKESLINNARDIKSMTAQGQAKISCKGPDSKYLSPKLQPMQSEPFSSATIEQNSQRQYVNE